MINLIIGLTKSTFDSLQLIRCKLNGINEIEYTYEDIARGVLITALNHRPHKEKLVRLAQDKKRSSMNDEKRPIIKLIIDADLEMLDTLDLLEFSLRENYNLACSYELIAAILIENETTSKNFMDCKLEEVRHNTSCTFSYDCDWFGSSPIAIAINEGHIKTIVDAIPNLTKFTAQEIVEEIASKAIKYWSFSAMTHDSDMYWLSIALDNRRSIEKKRIEAPEQEFPDA